MAPRRIYWAILTGLLLATTTGLAGDGYNEPLMQSIMESVALAVLGDVMGDVVITTETN